MQIQGTWWLRTPQPVGTSGQLGKEQTLACAEDLFSRYVSWTQLHQTARLTEESVQSAATLKLFQRLLASAVSVAAAALVASYEAASALASRPSPEIFGLLIPNYKSYYSKLPFFYFCLLNVQHLAEVIITCRPITQISFIFSSRNTHFLQKLGLL